MERVAVVEGVRTPFLKMGTEFNAVKAQELGRIVCREVIERSGIDARVINEVIIGNVGQPADAANIARVIALISGVPEHVPALTVHRNCASGMEAAIQAAMKIQIGEGACYLVGGAESMSNIGVNLIKPLQDRLVALSKAKTMGQRLSEIAGFYPAYLDFSKSLQPCLNLGLTDPVCGLNMGQTAEILAKEFGITREEQDEFALMSHQKACAARACLREEIVPVVPGPKYKSAVTQDNGPRENQTMKALAKLKPVFDRRSGTVTAGNASQITDGACALLIMSQRKAEELGLKPLGFIKAYDVAAVGPERMGIGPAHAIPRVLRKAQMRLKDLQVIEINEAFAAQVLACLKSLASEKFARDFGYEGYTGEIDRSILNINGGAVAIGHPVGATGARLILTTLMHMRRRDLRAGVVSLCVGGGQGVAVILER